jgi:hypothetical protein
LAELAATASRPSALDRGDKRTCVAKRSESREVVGLENFAAPFGNALAAWRIRLDVRDGGHQLVAAHPDGAANLLKVHVDPASAKAFIHAFACASLLSTSVPSISNRMAFKVFTVLLLCSRFVFTFTFRSVFTTNAGPKH